MTDPKKSDSKAEPTKQNEAATFDEMEDEDIMKLIYGGCGSCPSAGGCGSADLDEDGNPTDNPKEKK